MNCKKTKRTLVRQCDSWYYRVSRKHKLLEKKTDHNAHSVYQLGVNPPADIAFGRIAEVRSKNVKKCTVNVKSED